MHKLMNYITTLYSAHSTAPALDTALFYAAPSETLDPSLALVENAELHSGHVYNANA